MARYHRSLHTVLLACLLAGAALSQDAMALDPATRLQDYNRTIFTARDGVPAKIDSMIQTADGWIWAVAPAGLYRFDGTRFEPYPLPGQDRPGRGRIASIYPGAHGDLWISYTVSGGLSVLHPNGKVEDLAGLYDVYANVHKFTVAADGALWAATGTGVRYFSGAREILVGQDAGLPAESANSILFAPDGQLWVVTATGVYVRQPGAARFDKHGDVKGYASLIRSPDGRIWMALRDEDRIELLSTPASGQPPAREPMESRLTSLFDRDGNLWTVTCPNRLCLTRPAAIGLQRILHPAAWTAQARDLPLKDAGKPAAVMEDMAGAIWIATDRTVERLRNSRLAQVPFAGSDSVSLARDHAGRILAADSSTATAWTLNRDGAMADRLHPIQMVSSNHDGTLLLASRRELVRQTLTHTERIAMPPRRDGTIGDLDVLGLQDDGRVIWMVANQTGLVGYVDGQWKPRSAFNLPKPIMLSTPAGGGRIWFACADGSVNLYDNDKLTRYDGRLIGAATLMDADRDVVIAGDHGMAVLRGAGYVALSGRDPDVLRNVTGIAVTANGDRWLNGGKGVAHVRASDWQASMRNPTTPLRYELLDSVDGYTGHAALDNRLPSAFADKDDQLWFATTEGMLHLDPRRLAGPVLLPAVRFTGLSDDGADIPLGAAPVLRPLPHDVNISYVAPGAARPETVRYQYRLAGEETRWQDAGARRTAFYTGMAPGPHRLDVRAANADGVWAEPSSLAFTVTPTLAQTTWFRCLLAVLLAVILYALYRWRMQALAAQFRARVDERIDERNRIARELHDTLLQSVQGLLLKVHGAAVRLAPDEPVKDLLEDALQQAERTITEARTRVRDLRGDADGLALATLLAAIGKELGGPDGPVFTLQVIGAERPLRGDVARDMFAIGREALVNAFRHATARAIVVTLDFSPRQLRLQIDDDGVGLPPHAAGPGGTPGHWGIAGMRERARSIAAELTVTSSPTGTHIVATLPAARVYAGRTRRWWRRSAF